MSSEALEGAVAAAVERTGPLRLAVDTATVEEIYRAHAPRFRRVAHAIVGDRDDWVSAQQVQAHVHAVRLRGGRASIRSVPGAAHSFDRVEPIQRFEDARVSPGAPTAYLASDGAFIHPVTGEADAALVDRDLAVYALKAGYGVRGATLGSQGDQAALFRDEMTAFFRRTLLD